jgi:hypothetical protein
MMKKKKKKKRSKRRATPDAAPLAIVDARCVDPDDNV